MHCAYAWVATVMLLIAVTAAGCTPQAQPSLLGTTWRAVQVWDDAQGSLRPVVDRAPTLTFRTEDQLTGTGGCNTYRGGYRVSGASLQLSGVASTEMYCYPPGAPTTGQSAQMMQETAYLKALTAVSTFAFDGPRLVLSTGGRPTLVLEPS